MKQTFTDISLVVLSVLYLFEVDYRASTVLNWVGFVIVLVVLVPVIIRAARFITNRVDGFQQWKQKRLDRKKAK